jgi:hypothetical protein
MAPGKVYEWNSRCRIGAVGERVLDAYFKRSYQVVHASEFHQRVQKFDRTLIGIQDGMNMHRVEYKTDETAGDTENLALEEVSVLKGNHRTAMGWIHTTIATAVVFYVPGHDRAYWLPLKRLRQQWEDLSHVYAHKWVTTVRYGDEYDTEIVPVPIVHLRNRLLITREWPLPMCQLGLFL